LMRPINHLSASFRRFKSKLERIGANLSFN